MKKKRWLYHPAKTFMSLPNLRQAAVIKSKKSNPLQVKRLRTKNVRKIKLGKIKSPKIPWQIKTKIIKTGKIKASKINSDTLRADNLKIQGGIPCLTFTELKFKGLIAGDEFQSIPSQNTSLKTTVTYMVANRSKNTKIEAQIEISPNNSDFFLDTFPITIEPGKNHVFVPLRFSKFTRVSFRSIEKGNTAKIDIFFQAQEQSSKKT
ncbi:DUF6385 domain-containing protein [Effusibacillus consociatus]|uniref:DUF6385 domain-containing protein n=1 Tax=Effusibacillus consociatus TaxID=1117041 RepID=A0ABV9PYC2_9BACL